MNIKERLEEFKSILVSLAAVVAIIFGCIMYFAPAVELAEFKQQYYQDKMWSRMEYLDRSLSDIEFRYKCYTKQECAEKDVPEVVYKEYLEKKIERERLKDFLKRKLGE